MFDEENGTVPRVRPGHYYWTPELGRQGTEGLQRFFALIAAQDRIRNYVPPEAAAQDRAVAYIAKEPPAIAGEHGHNRCYHVACILVQGFNLSEEEAYLAIQDWNATCVPPWSEKELRHKLREAETKPDPKGKPRGYLLDREGKGRSKSAPARSDVDDDSQDEMPAGERIIIRASEIPARQVEWLWPGRIPLGKLTTFAGQTGQGKTFVACEIMARVTRGDAWPDGQEACETPSQVLCITGDDDPDDTLVPRLIEANAVLEWVVFLTEKAQAGWTMAALKTLDRAITEAGGDVRLVVIDPPTSFLAGVDDHKNAELRAILTPFKDWAKRNRVAVILITHVNKGGSAQVEAMMRVMGSVAWVTGVRTAYMFVGDPNDEEQQLFLTLKNNLGPKAKGWAYRIVDGLFAGRVEWIKEVDMTADEAMNRHKKDRPRQVLARDWLIGLFRQKLEWPSDEFWASAKVHHVSKNAIDEARVSLEMPKPRKITTLGGDTSWVWWVPASWPPLQDESEIKSPGSVSTTPADELGDFA